MPHFRISLSGPSIHEPRVPGALLRDLLEVLVEGTRRALRLRLEGRSTARGTPPSYLAPGARFDVVGLTEGSTVVVIDAPRLQEALAPELPQFLLFEQLDPSSSALDLLMDGLDDALHGRADSDRYDSGLLRKLEQLERVFDAGVTRVRISDGDVRTRGQELTIDPESLETVKQLRGQTPPDQAVRVAGRLDVIRHSDRMFALILASGVTLRGIAERLSPEELARFFGRQVVVSGTVVFRPSGRVQTIEADDIELAEGDVSLWAGEPRPLFAELPPKELYRPQDPRSGVSAIIGKWPGDESDEEIERLLDELS